MAPGIDQELGDAVAEYQSAATNDERIASLKKISSQVKHKALAESTAVSIIGLVTEAIAFRGEVRDAALALLAYLVRRMHSQHQLSSEAVSTALNGIPNWPDTLTDLRKRGVPADIRAQLQEALERPPSSGRATPSAVNVRPLSRMGERRAVTTGARPGSSASGPAPTSPAVVDNGLDPIYISGPSQLDQMCRDMLPDFEGKESEHNWPKRDKNMTKLRQITKGNAPADFSAAYIANFKMLFEGIVKCATSLRTTFSTNGCAFIQEAAAAIGHGLDAYSGRLFEMAIKMCSDTKPIAAQNGSNTVVALIANVSWSKHILQFIENATTDKNVRPREFAYLWLKAALEVYSQRKSVLEQGHGLDALEKCFRRGIADPNPKVRETAKKIFWDFHSVWPTRGEAILFSLDDRVQKSMHAINPAGDSSGQAAAPKAATPAKARVLGNRPSMKDIIAAKKREQAMQRPQSALANMQSAESKPDFKKAAPTRPAAARAAPETSSGLSGAPVRPGRKVVTRQPSRGEGLANGDADRPKTPFRAGAVQRPQSRMDDKKADGPRRPVERKPAVPLRPGNNVVKSVATNSLPASPEKARDLTPSHRRPKSISEDIPIMTRSPKPTELNRMSTPPRISTPASIKRPQRDHSPLQSHPSLSRMSMPAHVYEDPRSSPSTSPPSAHRNATPMLDRHLSNSANHAKNALNLTPRLAGRADSSGTFSEGFSPVKMPLMELSNNEVNTPQSSLKKDPRSAKLIDSGIVHMKTGKLDPHGYRKLHDAVVQNVDGLTAAKFEELLFGVLQPTPGREFASATNPSISSDRILVQRLHLLSALAKVPLIQPYFALVLRTLIHILRHDARPESHTFWVAEGMMKEFAQITVTAPNATCNGVLEQPQDMLHAIVLKCVALLVQNRAFDKADGELVAVLAELAGQAIANHKDVDARIQGHQLAQALGPDAIKDFLGEEKAGVAFMLYQNVKSGA